VRLKVKRNPDSYREQRRKVKRSWFFGYLQEELNADAAGAATQCLR